MFLCEGYAQSWSDELFVIDKVQRTFPWTYLLKDLKGEPVLGAFYELELSLAEPAAVTEETESSAKENV